MHWPHWPQCGYSGLRRRTHSLVRANAQMCTYTRMRALSQGFRAQLWFVCVRVVFGRATCYGTQTPGYHGHSTHGQYSTPWVPWAVLNPGCHGHSTQPLGTMGMGTVLMGSTQPPRYSLSIAPLFSSIARSESSRYKAAELWARLSMLLASHQLYHNQVRHSRACMRIAVLAHSVCKRVRGTHMNGPALACRRRS